MTITNVGVIGCGLMGSGIVQVSAQAGFQVLFVEANDELVRRGLGRLKETLEGLASRGKLDAKAKDAALARIADRKSTRLNSSHGYISYAVFCLKKKKTTPQTPSTPYVL